MSFKLTADLYLTRLRSNHALTLALTALALTAVDLCAQAVIKVLRAKGIDYKGIKDVNALRELARAVAPNGL